MLLTRSQYRSYFALPDEGGFGDGVQKPYCFTWENVPETKTTKRSNPESNEVTTKRNRLSWSLLEENVWNFASITDYADSHSIKTENDNAPRAGDDVSDASDGFSSSNGVINSGTNSSLVGGRTANLNNNIDGNIGNNLYEKNPDFCTFSTASTTPRSTSGCSTPSSPSHSYSEKIGAYGRNFKSGDLFSGKNGCIKSEGSHKVRKRREKNERVGEINVNTKKEVKRGQKMTAERKQDVVKTGRNGKKCVTNVKQLSSQDNKSCPPYKNIPPSRIPRCELPNFVPELGVAHVLYYRSAIPRAALMRIARKGGKKKTKYLCYSSPRAEFVPFRRLKRLSPPAENIYTKVYYKTGQRDAGSAACSSTPAKRSNNAGLNKSQHEGGSGNDTNICAEIDNKLNEDIHKNDNHEAVHNNSVDAKKKNAQDYAGFLKPKRRRKGAKRLNKITGKNKLGKISPSTDPTENITKTYPVISSTGDLDNVSVFNVANEQTSPAISSAQNATHGSNPTPAHSSPNFAPPQSTGVSSALRRALKAARNLITSGLARPSPGGDRGSSPVPVDDEGAVQSTRFGD